MPAIRFSRQRGPLLEFHSERCLFGTECYPGGERWNKKFYMRNTPGMRCRRQRELPYCTVGSGSRAGGSFGEIFVWNRMLLLAVKDETIHYTRGALPVYTTVGSGDPSESSFGKMFSKILGIFQYYLVRLSCGTFRAFLSNTHSFNQISRRPEENIPFYLEIEISIARCRKKF